MSNEDLTSEEVKNILSALDHAVKTGPWDKSLFLRAIGKKLEGVRDEFCQGLQLDDTAHMVESVKNMDKHNGQQEVFVSIYNANGGDLRQWEQVVHNLAMQSISRPTYDSEEAIHQMIRSKSMKENEGYVSVYLSKTDILIASTSDKASKDRLGIPLLTIRDKSIHQANVIAFYHKSGRYVLEQGSLVRKGDVDFSGTL